MLPQGFTRVEWIGCDGSQYIDAGLKMTGNSSVRIKFKMQNVASDNSPIYPIYGAATNYNSNAFELWGVSNGFATYGSQSFKSQFGMTAGIEHEAFQDKNVLNFEGQSIAFTKQDFTTPVNLLLFATNRNGTIYRCEAAAGLVIMQAQIYDNDVILRDYIPFVDQSGVANFWDETNSNAANKSGVFSYGKAIVPEKISELSGYECDAGICISWKQSENANEYIITRDGVQIASVYGNVTSYTDIGVIGEYEYTVTPYNGTQAGAGASISVRTSIDTPANLNAIIDGRTVALTWDAVSGAEGYKVYRDGAVVASVSSTAYTDTLTPPASVAYAVSAYAGTIQSEMSQTVVVENWEGVLLTLITDRTDADVAEAKRLRDKLIAGEALTDEESARYFAGLRGCYNASDMNRVGAAVRYVANRLNAEGYGAYVDPKTDWQMEDIVRQSDWDKYLDEVRHLRRKLTLMRTTPQITDGMYSGLKSYAEANEIERILVDLDIAITCIIRNYIFSGEVFAGEV